MRRRACWSSMFVVVWVCATLVPLVALPAASFEGKPAFKGGEGYGYYIWHEGNTWKVRWTTYGAAHRFSGRVVTEGGDFEDMKRIDVDTERTVLVPGRGPQVTVGPRGRVYTRGGRAPVVAEKTEDHIERDDARTIRFSTRTDEDLDGFDFKLKAGVKLIRFNLQVDGRNRPAEVTVGKLNQHPQGNPFVAELPEFKARDAGY